MVPIRLRGAPAQSASYELSHSPEILSDSPLEMAGLPCKLNLSG